MKSLIKVGFLSFMAALTFTACEEDAGIGGGSGGPGTGGGNDAASIIINSGAGLVSDAATFMPLDTFFVSVDVTPGDAQIKAIGVREDGSLIDFSRITYDGSPAPANVWLIPEAAKGGFESVVGIVAHSDLSTKTYSIEVTDDADQVSSQSVTITTVIPPNIVIEGSGMPMTSAGSIIGIPINVTDVTNPLRSIGVKEDGVYISETRLWYDDLNLPFPSNPAGIPDEDVNGIMITLYIRAHETPGSTRTYTVIIGDESGGEYESSLTITTGTAVLLYEKKLFFNADGPMDGGMDLDLGESVSFNSIEAEIKDEGIDNNRPTEENWIQRISGANDTEVKHLIVNQNGLPETFSFDNISTSEEIASLWDSGTAFMDQNENGEFVSLLVEIGDTFIAKKDSKFYMFKVKDINITTMNNEDYYEIDIKL